MNHTIRLATSSDSEALLNIYSPYVSDTAISFETVVPTVNEFSCRIETICKQYPYLVYQIDNEIVGFAYASSHRERDAYRYDVNVSIYVLPQYHGSGVSYKLYGCLFELLTELGYYNAYAACTVPNDKSKHFHNKTGFILIGTHHKTGYKFGQWHDVAWFEKTLTTHKKNPIPIKSIDELSNEFLNSIFTKYTTV